MSAPVLRVEDLAVRRGPPGARRTILRDVCCWLDAGDVLMLLGANGAGKSTLLHTLAGQLPASGGTVCLAGRRLHDWPASQLARRRAVLMQHTTVNLQFTVEEIVRLGALAQGLGGAALEEAMTAVLAATELAALRHRSLPALSGGEQARVHLARVLLQLWPQDGAPRARLLLLDEPCASLDPYYQHQVCRTVRGFARSSGAAVAMSMHDMNLASQYADQLLVLGEGTCLAAGAPAAVLNEELVRRCFGVGIAAVAMEETRLLATHVPGDRHSPLAVRHFGHRP